MYWPKRLWQSNEDTHFVLLVSGEDWGIFDSTGIGTYFRFLSGCAIVPRVFLARPAFQTNVGVLDPSDHNLVELCQLAPMLQHDHSPPQWREVGLAEKISSSLAFAIRFNLYNFYLDMFIGHFEGKWFVVVWIEGTFLDWRLFFAQTLSILHQGNLHIRI